MEEITVTLCTKNHDAELSLHQWNKWNGNEKFILYWATKGRLTMCEVVGIDIVLTMNQQLENTSRRTSNKTA